MAIFLTQIGHLSFQNVVTNTFTPVGTGPFNISLDHKLMLELLQVVPKSTMLIFNIIVMSKEFS
jgi:hypothetical protein